MSRNVCGVIEQADGHASSKTQVIGRYLLQAAFKVSLWTQKQ
jgi:hypothetical protein